MDQNENTEFELVINKTYKNDIKSYFERNIFRRHFLKIDFMNKETYPSINNKQIYPSI